MDWKRGNIPYFEFPPKIDEDGNEIPEDQLKKEDLELPPKAAVEEAKEESDNEEEDDDEEEEEEDDGDDVDDDDDEDDNDHDYDSEAVDNASVGDFTDCDSPQLRILRDKTREKGNNTPGAKVPHGSDLSSRRRTFSEY